MNHIGEFHKDSTILLELLTKDENGQPIVTDFPPTATIEHHSQNGINQVDNVTLDTMDGVSHYYSYTIPQEWEYGTYIIRYETIIEGEIYTLEDTFELIPIAIEEPDVPDVPDVPDEPDDKIDYFDDYVDEDGEYIMPPEFQIPATIEVSGSRIIITPQDQARFNTTYTVVISRMITSTSGNRLEKTTALKFTSEYAPLLATPTAVQSILRSLYKYFSIHEVYTALRDASQKVHQLKDLIPDPDNARYRPMQERDEAYYPATKYVAYEAARVLLSSLIIKMLNDDDEGDGFASTEGGSISLGDFKVTDSSGSGNDAVKEESPLQKLQAIIDELERDKKFWKDAMMGHNRRGYAKPITGSYRSDAGSPEGRDFT